MARESAKRIQPVVVDHRVQTRVVADVAPPPPDPALPDGATPQHAFMIRAPIRAGQVKALEAVLAIVDRKVETNEVMPFLPLTTIHFARWVILPEAKDAEGRTVPASLVLSTNHDGTQEAHLEQIVELAARGLDRILSHCEGYPAEGARSRGSRLEFLRAHRDAASTFYVGTTGLSVGQIRREEHLRQRIEKFLDGKRYGRDADPARIREDIRAFVAADPNLAWALVPPSPSPKSMGKGTKILLGALALPVVLVFSPVLLAWIAVLRVKEMTDEVDPADRVGPHVKELMKREDQIVQNQMSSVLNVKTGFVRRWTLRAVLAFIDFAARRIYNQGSLGGIPSIHFARWVVLDDGRRLLFFSNFDGSWENYLGDFIDRAANGLTAVWSNCVGFPRTRFLILDGARDEQRFKTYSRNAQIPTQVWYSAYTDLTVENIHNNAQIRKGLSGQMDRDETLAWLRRF